MFQALSKVRKARGHANLADKADDPGVRDFLRNIYLNNLRFDLIALYRVLDKWISAGAPMEIEGD